MRPRRAHRSERALRSPRRTGHAWRAAWPSGTRRYRCPRIVLRRGNARLRSVLLPIVGAAGELTGVLARRCGADGVGGGVLADPAAVHLRRQMLRGVTRRRHPEARQAQVVDDRVECGRHGIGVGITVGRIPCGRAQHQFVELRWDATDRGAGRSDVMVHPLVCHRQRGVAVERGDAGQQLVGEDADGIDIAARGRRPRCRPAPVTDKPRCPKSRWWR